MWPKRRLASLASALGALLLFVLATTAAFADGLPVSTLKIIGPGGKALDFKVEVAATAKNTRDRLDEPELACGRYRHDLHLPAAQGCHDVDEGYAYPAGYAVIDAGGKVINIAENAKPMDETIIPSRGLTAYVLELSGGEAARLHLSAGDTVTGPALDFKARD